MTTRYNLTSPRKNGEGFQLIFDALPLPDADGRVMVLMSPPREDNRDGMSSRAQAADRAQRPARDDLDDEVPF